MKLEELKKDLISKKINPKLLYISGKTSTGKTTFTNFLEGKEYQKIELDQLVMKSIVEDFGVQTSDAFLAAYRGEGPSEQTNAFISFARQEVKKALSEGSIVVEGAVAQPEILQSILGEEFVFIYLHPVDVDEYVRRLTQRFVNGVRNGKTGLPKRFWGMIDQGDVDFFLKTNELNSDLKGVIKKYAQHSMDESVQRLNNFRKSFSGIIVIEF